MLLLYTYIHAYTLYTYICLYYMPILIIQVEEGLEWMGSGGRRGQRGLAHIYIYMYAIHVYIYIYSIHAFKNYILCTLNIHKYYTFLLRVASTYYQLFENGSISKSMIGRSIFFKLRVVYCSQVVQKFQVGTHWCRTPIFLTTLNNNLF